MDYHYVRWFPSDYMRDTRRLTLPEHGAYLLLLNEYYLTGEPLPDDDKTLSMMLSISLSEWLALRPAVAKHFQIANGVWMHARCEKEIKLAISTRAARVAGAEKTNAQRHAQRHAQRDLSDTQPEPESLSILNARAREGFNVKGLITDEAWEAELAYGNARKAGYEPEEINTVLEEFVHKGKSLNNVSNYLLKTLQGRRKDLINGHAPPKATSKPPVAWVDPAGRR